MLFTTSKPASTVDIRLKAYESAPQACKDAHWSPSHTNLTKYCMFCKYDSRQAVRVGQSRIHY